MVGIVHSNFFIIGITIGLVIALPLFLKSVFLLPDRVKIPTEQEVPSTEIKRIEFASAKWLSTFIILNSAIVFALSVIAYRLYISFFGRADIFIGVPLFFFIAPSIFVGIALSYWLVDLIFCKKFGSKYNLYWLALAREHRRVNVRKIIQYVPLLFMLFGFAANILLFSWKLVFYNDRFEQCSLTFCRSYAYLDVSELGISSFARAPNGNVVARNDFYMKFKNGSVFSPFILSNDKENIDKVSSYLARKTGLGVLHVRLGPSD